MWRRQLMKAAFSTMQLPSKRNLHPVKKVLIGTALTALAGLVIFFHQYKTNKAFQRKIDMKYFSKTLIGPEAIEATNVTPENLAFLRTNRMGVMRFVQIKPMSGNAAESSIHPHYSYYKKILLLRGATIKLYILDLSKWQSPDLRKRLIQELGLDEADINASTTDGLKYVLVNKTGNLLYHHSRDSVIDPIKHGLNFLEGPLVITKARDLGNAAVNTDKYEHTFFVIYTGDKAKKSPTLVNCYRKVFGELSYNLQQIATFIEINDQLTAFELGLDINQPGIIYTFHTLNKMNEGTFKYNRVLKIRDSSFGISHIEVLNKANSALTPAISEQKDFERIYTTVKEYIINALAYHRSVQYCPNVDYVKLYLSMYQSRKESVLYLAANPNLVTLAEFEELYKTAAELHKAFPNVRILLTDVPNVENFSGILPEINEKVSIRFINYDNSYQIDGASIKFNKNGKKNDGQNFVEKYRLDKSSNDEAEKVPSLKTLSNFINDCNKRAIQPHRECEECQKNPLINPLITKLNSQTYSEVLRNSIEAQSRIIICYCSQCVKCRQALDALISANAGSSTTNGANLYLYNIANESELNHWIKAAPVALHFAKGEMMPSKVVPLLDEETVVGENAEQKVIDKIIQITKERK